MQTPRVGLPIGVTQWSVDASGPDSLHLAAALGFRAIHLNSGEPDADERMNDAGLRHRYLQASRESGVAMAAISPGGLNDLGLTSPAGSANARKCDDSIRIAIDAAVDMEVPLVYLPSFRAGEIRDRSGLERTAAVLAEASDYAGDSVTIATENTLSAEGNLELLAAAGRPALRVMLDTENPFLWGQTVAAMVDDLWPVLVDQVHAKDGVGGLMGNAVLGEGECGFLETARALRNRGFAGTLISENDYHGERSALAARDIAIMSEVLGS